MCATVWRHLVKATEVTAGLADWLPVHRDHLRAQRSVTSIRELYLFLGSLQLENLIVGNHTLPSMIARDKMSAESVFCHAFLVIIVTQSECLFNISIECKSLNWPGWQNATAVSGSPVYTDNEVWAGWWRHPSHRQTPSQYVQYVTQRYLPSRHVTWLTPNCRAFHCVRTHSES